jgi:Rrf2 family transcriptional regulator, iron-sulfur cluster assembly transcription factor
MLVLSKKIFYAVEAVLYIAYNAKDSPISGNEIAAAQLLSDRYLEPMLQRLVRAGILRGMRGPQGGYVLGRERRRITLADICNALADKKDLPTIATPLGKKVLKDIAAELMNEWSASLETITIEQLCSKAQNAKILPTRDTHTSFAI